MEGGEEQCVVCGQATGYVFEDNIENRAFYVEGAGQLCEKCFGEIYGEKKEFDYTKKYSDAFYQSYIENFELGKKRKLFYRFIKRTFDIFSSLFALILLSPIMLIIAIAIKCNSKGPVIFKQKRVGKNGKAFNFYKFRSSYLNRQRFQIS